MLKDSDPGVQRSREHRARLNSDGKVQFVIVTILLPTIISVISHFAEAADSVSPPTTLTASSPAIQGFGAHAEGAAGSPDGNDVYHVNSLADEGPGTLREAVSKGGRQIVFDVSGVINLDKSLYINTSYLTIDGASAPSPGITISRRPQASFVLEPKRRMGPVHDIIVRHLRFDRRPGEAAAVNTGDVLGLDGDQNEVYNVIFDHLSVHQADDGIFDLRSNVHDITISWCLMTDTMECTAIGGYPSRPRRNITFHHNVWANNTERLPLLRNTIRNFEMVNNIIYQWEIKEHAWAATLSRDPSQSSSMNIINNYYFPGIGAPSKAIVYVKVPGPSDDNGPPHPVPQGTVWSGSRMGALYVNGNILPPENLDHWSTVDKPVEIPPWAKVSASSAEELVETVLPTVGTRDRTPDEIKLMEEIKVALCKDRQQRAKSRPALPATAK